MNYSLNAFVLLIKRKVKFCTEIKQLLSYVEYKIEVKGRSKQEYDICKFVNFVQINEAYPQKMKLVTYNFFIVFGVYGE